VEVVSLGRERQDGAALLLRVPDDVADDEPQNNQPRGGRYFRSLGLDEIRIPEPFALASRVQASGWQAETLKAEMPHGADFERLAKWAQVQSNSSQIQTSPER